MAMQFEQMNPFDSDLKTVLPPSTFDCVALFNRAHLMMESTHTADTLFANVSHLLKPGGTFLALMHDGAAIWYALQKDLPEGKVPPDYVPRFKRQLFAVTLSQQIEPNATTGVAYNFKVAKEEKSNTAISLSNGYLINATELNAAASNNGLSMVHILNCGDVYETYKGVYGDLLKKKASSRDILADQKQVLDMFAIAVFRKDE